MFTGDRNAGSNPALSANLHPSRSCLEPAPRAHGPRQSSSSATEDPRFCSLRRSAWRRHRVARSRSVTHSLGSTSSTSIAGTGYFDLLQPPGVPGIEAAGLIVAVGPEVSGFSVGDRIAYACPPVGAYWRRLPTLIAISRPGGQPGRLC
ncbi:MULTISPECIES: alcohol dehydrogenase catalytic domain-containing protein [unclassified Mesorhizobium]|uniref:alcohol dehydrogenase catalytic domain-containing protein n=1 Tax=unclassified Mesorhizobium TaxID=325217 RepID=UPI000FD3C17B|nr:hypothetical protein EOA19_07465 [Mesorhizobium sp. M7A.F.Ca.US.010.02.1.1]